MRPIKFRGKRLDNQEWEQGNYVAYKEDDGEDVHCIVSRERNQIGASLDFVPVVPETVGQFTGLLDKNGTEIYEGDIVMWGHVNNYSKETPHRQAAVKLFPALHFETFTKTEFGTPHKFHYGNFAYRETHKHLEIIGNIHDNPELLKTE